MLALGWFLTVVLTLTVIGLLVGLWGANGIKANSAKWFKLITAIYAASVALTLGIMVHHFIGWGSDSSPIPKRDQRSIAHAGYYFSRDGELFLNGKSEIESAASKNDEPRSPDEELRHDENDTIKQMLASEFSETDVEDNPRISDNGFEHKALAVNEFLSLKPIWNGQIANEWRLNYRINSRPLRLQSNENGSLVSDCINVPQNAWLDNGDTFIVATKIGTETRFISFTWRVDEKYWWPLNRKINSYYFAQGTMRNGVEVYEKGPLLMSERVLVDGLTLEGLVRRAKKEFRASVGTIGEEWWSLFQKISLVREQKGNNNSRIGILVSDDLLTLSDVHIYKRSSNGSTQNLLASRAEPTSIRISTDTIVTYGFTGRNSFDLKLSKEIVPDEVWGQVVYVEVLNPRKWTIPPEPNKEFIITSTNDYIPLDGYLVDIGESTHAFYAKAHLGQDLDNLYINDGRNVVKDKTEVGEPRQFAIDTLAPLGDYQQGILIKLTRSQSKERVIEPLNSLFGPLKHTGRVAILLIILNVLTFIGLTLAQRQGSLRPHLFLGWTIVWGIVLTLLTVRLVLAHRVSLIPPFDASFAEVRGIFDKGVDYGLVGLFFFALLTISLSFASRRSRHANWKTSSIIFGIAIWGLAITLYTVAGGLTSGNQSLVLRINIANHLLLLFGFALLVKPVLESRYRFLRGLLVFVVVIPLALQVFLVKDAGAIIYSCSLIFLVLLVFQWDSSKGILRNRIGTFIARRRWLRQPLSAVSSILPGNLVAPVGKLMGWLVPIIIGASPLLFLIFTPYLADRGIRKVVEPALPDTAFYRFASFTDTEDQILAGKSGEEDIDMSKLLDNSQQNWQMLLYASEGASSPAGYGHAPLSNVGMTYGTSVSDCVYSTYILGEHGKGAAFMLLLLYIFLALTGVAAGFYLDDNLHTRNIILIGIAGFFIYNTLYMAGANVGLLPFTGQNMPLLGLNSGGDLLQGLIMTFLIGWLLLRSTQEASPTYVWLRRPPLIRWSLGLFVGALLLIVAVTLRINQLGESDLYRQDHSISAETLDTMQMNLPHNAVTVMGQKRVGLELQGESLDKPDGSQLMEIEEQYRKQFNERTDKFNSNGGLYYLDRTRDASGASKLRVKINERFIYARSPFKEPVIWQGEIVAGGDNTPTLYGLNRKKVTISIQDKGYPGSVNLSDARSVRTTFSPLLREGNSQFCELTRDNERLILDPKQGDWTIFVDGKRLKPRQSVDLAPLSLIVIERRNADYRRNLIYLGPIRPVLAYVRWRNGERRRLFPESSFSLPYFIAKAADQTKTKQAEMPVEQQRFPDQLALTLDIDLHRTLQRYLINYAKSHRNYSPFRESPNRLAVTVLDAFSGKALALPSWPLTNPNKPDYEKLIDRVPEPTRSRLEDNANLSRHVVGSTIKPVVLATMATALWPTRDLGLSKIYNRGSAYSGTLASGETPIHPHLKVGGIGIELWDCNSSQPESDIRNFIVHSLDYPEGVLGMLGVVRTTQELNAVLQPELQHKADISFNGSDYSLDLMKASQDGVAISLQDQLDGRLAYMRGEKAVNDTLLFKGLSAVFDFRCSGLPEERLLQAAETFFPSFYNAKSFSTNAYVDNAIAARLDMGGGDYQGVRQGFLSCLLGGEPCGFNNVMMAESGSRLATGLRIFARLEDSQINTPSSLPPPLDNQSRSVGHQQSWRVENIIEPMEMVRQTGTADVFASTNPQLRVPAQYKALFKTGTIVEGNEGRESEALMFVIGRWVNGAFIPGETLAGFLYMERSKVKNPVGKKVADGDMKKFAFAAPLLNHIIDYMEMKRTQ